jgi:2,3-diketo-5-methylthiopentyl-1-phosphate enolase
MKEQADRIQPDEEIVAVYSMDVRRPENPQTKADLISTHTYPGTGTRVAGESSEAREMYSGRVIEISELAPVIGRVPGDAQGPTVEVRVGFPLRAFEDSVAMLLSVTAGEVLAYGGLRLVNLELPTSYVTSFKGPKFGIDGIRDQLGVRGRPFVLAIFKPSLGFLPEEGAIIFREAAIGGADLIKDDELLSDPSYCRRSTRVRRYLEAERQAFEETGEHTLYAVNITGKSDRVLANALEAAELGANALMVNYLQVGLDVTRSICENPRVTLPVLGHNAGASSFYGSRGTGMSMGLINGKLPRMCGLDLCVLLTQHGKFASVKEECIMTADEMRRASQTLRSTLPIAAGGVVPGLVPVLLSEYGPDCAIGSGGGIFGHPQGPRAGARAFRQAITASLGHLDSADVSDRFPELRMALEKWGLDSPWRHR